MLFQDTIPTLPFRKWIWQDSENKLLLWIGITAITIQFIGFKLLYPYPNFMPPDSNSYIEAAFSNQFINIWAIGYSKFLRLFSALTTSHLALVLFQYIFLQSSILYLLYTVRYLLAFGGWIFRVAVACCILNPLVPHISNFVSSDALFTSFSLIWFTQLLWILYEPRQPRLLIHAIVLVLAFTLRYTALFYPIISIIIIIFTKLKSRMKLMGISYIVLLLGLFIGRTSYQYYVETGTVQYSPFGAWLMASNPLYGYAYATPDPPEEVPLKFRILHTMVNRHMDSLRQLISRPDNEVAVYYFWDPKSPLLQYMYYTWRNDSTANYLKRWSSMAPLYADYGRYLMYKHPVLFIRYYVWPNLVKYYAPPSKFMGFYNMGRDSVNSFTAHWFGWKDPKVPTYFKDKSIQVSQYFTAFFAFVNLFFVMSFGAFIHLHGFKKCTVYEKKAIAWFFIVWVFNMCFSVLSAPIELRYQIFPMIITLAFGLLLLEIILQISRHNVQKATPVSHS